MAHLAENDLREVIALASGLSGLDGPESFGAAVLEPLRHLVHCDSVSYNEVDLRLQRNLCLVSPGDALDEGDPDTFAAFLDQHPVISYSSATGDGRACALSDLLTLAELRRTDLWNGYYRPVGVDHQIAICIELAPGVVVGIAFNRSGSDFGERDHEVLDLARPLLANAYRLGRQLAEQRRVIGELDAALDREGRGVISCTADGRLLAASTAAQRLLAESFGVEARPGQRLPACLVEQLAKPSGAPVPTLPVGHRLAIKVQHFAQEDRHLLVLSEGAGPQQSSPAAHLTGREVEVLELLASGRSSGEAAAALGISGRTLDKHLEHVRAKLGVSNRAAAVARWLTTRPG